jgi:hypothetical protein
MKKILIVLLFISSVAFAQNSKYIAALDDTSKQLESDLQNIEDNTDVDIDDLIEAARFELKNMDQATNDMAEEIKKANFKVSEITEYLTESQKSLYRMKIAVDQMGARMQESNEWLAAAYDDLDSADAKIAMLKVSLEIKTAQVRLIPVSFAFGTAFGVGASVAISGISQDNSTMTWAGVGTAGASALIWSIGHWLFEWW